MRRRLDGTQIPERTVEARRGIAALRADFVDELQRLLRMRGRQVGRGVAERHQPGEVLTGDVVEFLGDASPLRRPRRLDRLRLLQLDVRGPSTLALGPPLEHGVKSAERHPGEGQGCQRHPSVSRNAATASGRPTLAAHPPSATADTATVPAAHVAATGIRRALPSAAIEIATTNCIGVAQVGTPSATATTR